MKINFRILSSVFILAAIFLPGVVFSHPLDLINISPAETGWMYMKLGFTHIVPYGLDHILFVLGLFFLSPQIKALLKQITAFTAAHSITLSLAVFNMVTVPAGFVEPVIALSIIYIAIENIRQQKLSSWRVLAVFIFGLVHGMGFAGVLKDLGLPQSQFVNALVTFNIGVELGQIAVILAAYAFVGLWFKSKEWYHRRIVVPVSVVIAVIAAYWTVERVFMS
jgi:hydrogenase/urease accessory protein HupE